MNNEKFSDFSLFFSSLGKTSSQYLCYVTAVFIISGLICAGLYLNIFGFVDRVNSYILADELMHSMIRSTAAATLMALLIDLMEKRYGGQS